MDNANKFCWIEIKDDKNDLPKKEFIDLNK